MELTFWRLQNLIKTAQHDLLLCQWRWKSEKAPDNQPAQCAPWKCGVLVFIICASSLTRAVELIFKKWDFHFSPFNAFLTVCFWFTKIIRNSTLKLLRPRPRRKSGFKNSDLVSTKPKQNIFAYTSLFVLFSAVCTIFLFVFKNAYLLNFSSLLKLSFRLRNSERPGECSPDEDCCR